MHGPPAWIRYSPVAHGWATSLTLRKVSPWAAWPTGGSPGTHVISLYLFVVFAFPLALVSLLFLFLIVDCFISK